MKLSDQFYNKMGLSVTIRTCRASFDSFHAPLSKAEVADLGFDGFAIDFLDGPKPVLAMLCTESRLHTSLVGLRPVTDEVYARLATKDAIGQFVAGNQSYKTIRRREYGAAGISTSVQEVNRGAFWTDQPTDSSEKVELQRKLNELVDEIRESEEAFNIKKTERDGLEQIRKEITQRLVCSLPTFACLATNTLQNELRHQKGELQKEFNLWRTLPDKIGMDTSTLW